jgi:hypothetical protein
LAIEGSEMSNIAGLNKSNLEDYKKRQEKIQQWKEPLQYICLLDKTTLIQIHNNILNDVYDDPLIFDIMIDAMLDEEFEKNDYPDLKVL